MAERVLVNGRSRFSGECHILIKLIIDVSICCCWARSRGSPSLWQWLHVDGRRKIYSGAHAEHVTGMNKNPAICMHRQPVSAADVNLFGLLLPCGQGKSRTIHPRISTRRRAGRRWPRCDNGEWKPEHKSRVDIAALCVQLWRDLLWASWDLPYFCVHFCGRIATTPGKK